ncbi:MAG: hypothetical protein ACK4LA_06430, partial [Aquificaceae bacterium]
MKVALCEEEDYSQGILLRAIGLEGFEGYKCIKRLGGVDFFFDKEEQAQEFLSKYGKYVYAVG